MEAVEQKRIGCGSRFGVACRQILTPSVTGATRPGIRPGGWAFQHANPYYPDTDDTALS